MQGAIAALFLVEQTCVTCRYTNCCKSQLRADTSSVNTENATQKCCWSQAELIVMDSFVSCTQLLVAWSVRGEQFANAEHVEAITYTEPSTTLLKLLAGLTHEST